MHVRHDGYKVKDGTTNRLRRLKCDDPKCGAGIAYDGVEEAVTAAVLDLLDDETWTKIRTAQRPPEEPDADTAATIEAKLERMWQMVLDGTIEPEEYAEAKTRWSGELAVMTTPSDDLPDVADVREAWSEFSPEERLLVFRATVERLVILPATRRGGRGVDLARLDLDLVG